MSTTIPAKQLQVVANTVEELQRVLLRKETGWCRGDNTLYIKKENGEVVPVAASEAYVNASVDVALDAIDTHEQRTDNPHQVTAAQVGAYTIEEADATLAAHNTDPESHEDIRQAIADEATARDEADGEIITSLEDETTARRLNDELLEQQIAEVAVQTDWDEDDSQSMAFLKNRPAAISELEINALFI